MRKTGADVLYGYFVKRLSLCLQKGIASSINGRLYKLNSHTGSLDADLTWRHENVAVKVLSRKKNVLCVR